MSSGGNLQAQILLHLDTSAPLSTPTKWPDAIAACLSECDNRSLTSVAFPALGTGNIVLYIYVIELWQNSGPQWPGACSPCFLADGVLGRILLLMMHKKLQ